MDRFVPRRRRTALLLAMTLALAVWPATGRLARLPVISDDSAGDPGDGVLRPADSSRSASSSSAPSTTSPLTVEASTPTQSSVAFILVPYFVSPGQPWFLTFRLIRLDRTDANAWAGQERTASFGGRWHRAP
jgi:hypothetical protein